MPEQDTTRQQVRQYYGTTLGGSADLKTSACCTAEPPAEHLRQLIRAVHPEVRAKFYGCGSPIPEALEGATVLDLGCGTGRDCFVLSRLVGPQGRIIGVDMTAEQLEVARAHVAYHMDQYGYPEPNVSFFEGVIEDLGPLGIADASVDVVVSNCVINLSPDKERVFGEILRVLKPGGELYFSDIFSDRRIPTGLLEDPLLRGECLSGALYIEDFRRLMQRLGVADYRTISRAPVTIDDPDVYAKIGMVRFESVTVRAFKLELEDLCENYGHVARYRGSIAHHPHDFSLDDHHLFPTGLPVAVCGNTARMLSETRFGRHFEVQGDFSTHHGLFDCSPGPAAGSPSPTSSAGGPCC